MNCHYRVISSPIFDSAGQISAVIEVVEDITEKVFLESQRRMTQKMETIGTMAGGIAHDFNNILSGIFGFAQLAQKKYPSPGKSNQTY